MHKILYLCLVFVLGLSVWGAVRSELQNNRRLENEWSAARQLTINGYELHTGYTVIRFAETDTILITSIRNPNYLRGTVRYIISDSTSLYSTSVVYIRHYDPQGRLTDERSGGRMGDYLLPNGR